MNIRFKIGDEVYFVSCNGLYNNGKKFGSVIMHIVKIVGITIDDNGIFYTIDRSVGGLADKSFNESYFYVDQDEARSVLLSTKKDIDNGKYYSS